MKQATLGFFGDGPDDEGVRCPTCGRVDFANEHGMKTHHALSHGEALGRVTVECAWCGDLHERPPFEVRGRDHHFCDNRCQGEWRSENWVGEANPLWKGVTVECAWCGDPLEKSRSRVKKYDHHFCGLECHGEWLSENWVGEANPLWKRVTVECEWCGDPLERPPSDLKGRDHHFCGLVCRGEWQSENLVGEANPLWKGGHATSYGTSWHKQRHRALERDGHECRMCGRSREGHHELYGTDLHVHHICPFRTFGLDDHEEANALENLITLCRGCHEAFEPISQART